MDTIRNYIDNVFSGLEPSQAVSRAKSELLSAMEDKYNELKAQGKTENEAIGIVISEFGNIDELIQELGAKRAAAPAEDTCRVSLDEAKEYLSARKKCGILIGLGVALILIGVAFMVWGGSIDKWAIHVVDTGLAGLIAFFVLLAIAVMLFVLSGMRLSKYEVYEKKLTELSPEARIFVTDKKAAFSPRFPWGIAIGVVLCVLSVVPLLILQNGTGVAVLLILVAIGVFLLINFGMQKGSLDILLSENDYTPEKRQENQLSGKIASVYWPAVTCAFLAWGFIGNAWSRAWIIWPIAGVAFGVFCAIYSSVSQHKKH